MVVIVLAVFVALFERDHIALALADVIKFFAVRLDHGGVELEVGQLGVEGDGGVIQTWQVTADDLPDLFKDLIRHLIGCHNQLLAGVADSFELWVVVGRMAGFVTSLMFTLEARGSP